MSECGWKFINWLVEMFSISKISECRRKFIYMLIESITIDEVDEGVGELV
jgi:hypothetical protein